MNGISDHTLRALREQRTVLIKAVESFLIPLSEHRLRSGPRGEICWEIGNAGNTAGKRIKDSSYLFESVICTRHCTKDLGVFLFVCL